MSLIALLEGTKERGLTRLPTHAVRPTQTQARERSTFQQKRKSAGGFARALAFLGSSDSQTQALLPTMVSGGSEPCWERSQNHPAAPRSWKGFRERRRQRQRFRQRTPGFMRYRLTAGSGVACGAIAHNVDTATALRDLVCYCECELEGLSTRPGDTRFTSMSPKDPKR